MELKRVKILNIKQLTPDTKSFLLEKPLGYSFFSGQAFYLSVNSSSSDIRPYSICSSPKSDNLELIIKIYSDRPSFTQNLDKLKVGDYLWISKAFGNLDYKKSKYKSYVFVAAGSAITKFISLLRSLKDDELKDIVFIYSNKTKSDVILEGELKSIFSGCKKNLVLVLSREKVNGYVSGRIDESLLKKYFVKDSKVVISGPDDFVKEMMDISRKLQNG